MADCDWPDPREDSGGISSSLESQKTDFLEITFDRLARICGVQRSLAKRSAISFQFLLAVAMEGMYMQALDAKSQFF